MTAAVPSSPSDEKIRIIVVEDEPDLRDEIVSYLSKRGLAVASAATPDEFWRTYATHQPEAVVLDLGLREDDGSAIAQKLRAQAPEIGIIMATGRRSVSERIAGYETGADVYMVKPVDLGELLAAIRATLRRPPPHPQDAWHIDLNTWQLTAPSGSSIQLTHAETILIDSLSEVPGEPVSRFHIAERLGKALDLSDHRYVDQTVRRLRRKIEATTDQEAPIRSVYASGYSFSGAIVRR